MFSFGLRLGGYLSILAVSAGAGYVIGFAQYARNDLASGALLGGVLLGVAAVFAYLNAYADRMDAERESLRATMEADENGFDEANDGAF